MFCSEGVWTMAELLYHGSGIFMGSFIAHFTFLI